MKEDNQKINFTDLLKKINSSDINEELFTNNDDVFTSYDDEALSELEKGIDLLLSDDALKINNIEYENISYSDDNNVDAVNEIFGLVKGDTNNSKYNNFGSQEDNNNEVLESVEEIRQDDVTTEVLEQVKEEDVTTEVLEQVEVENNQKKENSEVKKFLFNTKIILIIAIISFICVGIVILRNLCLSKKADNLIIDGDDTKIYDGDDILRKGAASELVECISSSVDTDDLPDSINSIINELKKYYKSSNNYVSFAYKDIFTGFTVSYNADQNVFTASTIKAPTDIYIWEMASMGNVDLDEELTYTSNYYNTGTGVLKEKEIGTKYTVRELLGYSIINSDNAAHNMLMDKYGRSNMLKFWQEKGTTAIFTQNNNWGILNAHDALIYMSELYRFYLSDQEYGIEAMNNFIKAKTKFITGKKDYVVANKSGWSGTSIHDVAIIFADNPYIVVALSNLGTSNYKNYFNTVNDLAYKLHEEYWKYKMSKCESIKQY